MKVMCLYLPQYHEFKENNEWWGKGYTEWVAVKGAKPLYKDHVQPRIPLNQNYYDLKNDGVKTWKWQAELAQKYGIYGFCIYHYWFRGQQLMEKPMEILLDNPDIPLRYSIAWANETWTRTWYGLESQVLMEQTYGTKEDWSNHFQYLLRFFKDDRYIKIDNKPMLHIYRTKDIACLPEMMEFFNDEAKKNGFDGIFLVAGNTAGQLEDRENLADGFYDFEPGYTLKHHFGFLKKNCYQASVFWKTMRNRFHKKKILERSIPAEWILGSIETRKYKENEFPGLIPDWDNTPRRSYKGLVYKGTNPRRFGEILDTFREKVKDRKYDFVYINAWNEWGEGAMIEPDEERKYGYLEEIYRAVRGEAEDGR